jgi:hypothetical protein
MLFTTFNRRQSKTRVVYLFDNETNKVKKVKVKLDKLNEKKILNEINIKLLSYFNNEVNIK